MKTLVCVALVLAPLLILAGFACLSPDEPKCERIFTPDYSWTEIRTIYQQERNLEAEHQKQKRFRQELNALVRGLAEGETQPAEAAAVLHEAAERDNPRLLRLLESKLPARPLRQQLLRVLHDNLDAQLRSGLIASSRVEEVQRLCERIVEQVEAEVSAQRGAASARR